MNLLECIKSIFNKPKSDLIDKLSSQVGCEPRLMCEIQEATGETLDAIAMMLMRVSRKAGGVKPHEVIDLIKESCYRKTNSEIWRECSKYCGRDSHIMAAYLINTKREWWNAGKLPEPNS